MTTPLTAPPDPLVVDWLLSALCRRLYFAAEVGLLACFEYPPERYAPFIDAHVARPLRALAEVLRIAAADADRPAAGTPLEGVVLWAESLTAAMLTLGRFRSLSRADCDDAAEGVTEAWRQLRQCAAELAAALGVEVSFLRDLPPGREQGVATILDGLCAHVLAEHGRSRGPG